MKPPFLTLVLLIPILIASCATEKAKELVGWPGSDVYMLPQEGGFVSETLELKDGRFRYWFSGDVILHNDPLKYPIEGNYEFTGNQLNLSSGKTFTVRSLKGNQSLWRPYAIDVWSREQIIDTYGILLPVESINSPKPTIKLLFAKEEWERSAEQVRKLEQKK